MSYADNNWLLQDGGDFDVGDLVRGANATPTYQVVAKAADKAWVRDTTSGADHIVEVQRLKREGARKFGCHVDLEPGMLPDGCVIDEDRRDNCIYARDLSKKEQCQWWRQCTESRC